MTHDFFLINTFYCNKSKQLCSMSLLYIETLPFLQFFIFRWLPHQKRVSAATFWKKRVVLSVEKDFQVRNQRSDSEFFATLTQCAPVRTRVPKKCRRYVTTKKKIVKQSKGTKGNYGIAHKGFNYLFKSIVKIDDYLAILIKRKNLISHPQRQPIWEA